MLLLQILLECSVEEYLTFLLLKYFTIEYLKKILLLKIHLESGIVETRINKSKTRLKY